jgi:hypothetical protein
MLVSKILRYGCPMLAIAVACGLTALAGDPPPKAEEKTPPVLRCPWDTDDDYAVRQRLYQTVVELKLDAVPLDETLERLSKMSGITIAANWTALEANAIERTTEVTLSVYNLRISKILDLILSSSSGGEVELLWDVTDGFVWISTIEDWCRRTETAVYDCADLVTVAPPALAKYVSDVFDETLRLTKRDISHNEAEIERLIRQVIRDSRKDLQRSISSAIHKDVDRLSWDVEGGNVGAMEWVGTKLVVVQTRQAHWDIFKLLTALRREPMGQKAIGQWP